MARPKPEGGSNVSLTFEDALKVIKGIDELSRGVQKIFYLVGWQYDGHDWKYPAFFEFNEALKRPQDATAADSYRWLREEAKKYNTTISVHVLLGDAYENSPLWEHYLKNGFICRDAQGNLKQHRRMEEGCPAGPPHKAHRAVRPQGCRHCTLRCFLRPSEPLR